MSSSGFAATGLTALANAAQAGALQLSSSAYFNQISTCTTTNNSCLLPATAVSGKICKIRNDSATQVSLNVFPQVGGTLNGVANASVVVPWNSLAEFIATGSNAWMLVSFSGVPFNFGMPSTTVADQAGGAGVTLTAANAGLVFIAAQTTGATAINIPSPVGNPGLRYKFIASATLGQAVAITPAAGGCTGALINAPTAGATCVTCSNKANVTMNAVATAGTSVELISDGTRYLTIGLAAVAASWA